MPKRAGYLAYAPKAGVLYSVDERKTDGRGPKLPASSVMAFKVDQADRRADVPEPAADRRGHAGLHHRGRGQEAPLDRQPRLLRSRGQGRPARRRHVGREVRVRRLDGGPVRPERRRLHRPGPGRPRADRLRHRPERLAAGRRPRAGQPSRAHRRDRPLGQVHGGVREGRRAHLRLPHRRQEAGARLRLPVPGGHRPAARRVPQGHGPHVHDVRVLVRALVVRLRRRDRRAELHRQAVDARTGSRAATRRPRCRCTRAAASST